MSTFSEEEKRNRQEYVMLDSLKKTRACFRCHLVKTEVQFRKEGCENCPYFKQNSHSYMDYTSANFEGLISVIDPDVSWVAKHLNIHRFLPGTYCLKIRDEIKGDALETLKAHKINFANNP